MRKYVKQWVNRKRGPDVPLDQQSIWDVLGCFVSSTPSSYRPRLRGELTKSILNKDTTSLFSLLEVLDSLPQKYGRNRPSLETVECDRAILAIAKKYPAYSGGIGPEQRTSTAKGKLLEAEDRCRRTNDYLRAKYYLRDENLSLLVTRAKYICSEILGPLDDKVYREILRSSLPGTGATVSDRGSLKDLYSKIYRNKLTVTPRAYVHFKNLLREDEQWLDLLDRKPLTRTYPVQGFPFTDVRERKLDRVMLEHVDMVASDEILFVPKDVKTDRPIALSASCNMMLQRGACAVIHDRLKQVGINLNDQTKNQHLAKQGSAYPGPKAPCTIDLSSASDTISYEMVKAVLPSDWFALLDDLRHTSGKTTSGDMVIRRYEKFSAMGNGYTFQLESLLFYCVVKAAISSFGDPVVCPRHVSVYGDDIIVREADASKVVKALKFFGFQVNQEKSFLSGPFKESCGGDYYDGCNVRGVYLKRPLIHYRDLYFLCNLTRDRRSRFYSKVYWKLRDLIPSDRLFFSPKFCVDDGLYSPLSELRGTYYSPYLTDDEQRFIEKRGVKLNTGGDQNLPFVLRSTRDFAKQRGYQRAMLYCCMLSQRVLPTSQYSRDIEGFDISTGTFVRVDLRKQTRNATATVVPNWDYSGS